jgi:hypothetical protein
MDMGDLLLNFSPLTSAGAERQLRENDLATSIFVGTAHWVFS